MMTRWSTEDFQGRETTLQHDTVMNPHPCQVLPIKTKSTYNTNSEHALSKHRWTLGDNGVSVGSPL